MLRAFVGSTSGMQLCRALVPAGGRCAPGPPGSLALLSIAAQESGDFVSRTDFQETQSNLARVQEDINLQPTIKHVQEWQKTHEGSIPTILSKLKELTAGQHELAGMQSELVELCAGQRKLAAGTTPYQQEQATKLNDLESEMKQITHWKLKMSGGLLTAGAVVAVSSVAYLVSGMPS